MMLKPTGHGQEVAGRDIFEAPSAAPRGSWATAAGREDVPDPRLATVEKYWRDKEPRPIGQEGCWRSKPNPHRHKLGHPRDVITTADLTDVMGRTDSPTEILFRLVPISPPFISWAAVLSVERCSKDRYGIRMAVRGFCHASFPSPSSLARSRFDQDGQGVRPPRDDARHCQMISKSHRPGESHHATFSNTVAPRCTPGPILVARPRARCHPQPYSFPHGLRWNWPVGEGAGLLGKWRGPWMDISSTTVWIGLASRTDGLPCK